MAARIGMAIFAGVAVAGGMAGVGCARDAFVFAHKGRAHIGMELAIAGESFKAFAAVELFAGTGVLYTVVVAGAAGVEGAGGKLFVFPARCINIFLVTAYFFGCSFRYAVSILFF